MRLRKYQTDLENKIYAAWNDGARNVIAVLPTGTGKTVIFAKILADHQAASCVIAHRQELVGQISLALAREGARHKIIAPNSVIRFIIQIHMSEVGRSYYDPNARCGVAGVDTLVRRADRLRDWLNRVTLWTLDEAHHLLKKNKWGKAVDMMPQARGLGVTATPTRADGKGLGRHTDGLFDALVSESSMREIIEDGYLTDYRIFAPASDLNLSEVPISAATGDYSPPQLRAAVHKSRIVGDVVKEYKAHADGLLGVTFVTDVETASATAAAFNVVGTPAEVVSHKTPDRLRVEILRRFKAREILQLVNVDLFGEGFDLPAIQVVSFARPTESFALYVQQFGRGLRLLLGDTNGYDLSQREGRLAAIGASTKPTAIIIDHVGNVERHRLPDSHRVWTLNRCDRRKRDQADGIIPVRICVRCTAVYERLLKICPECGCEYVPAGRSTPEQVDGDLTELDAAALARLRGEVAAVDLDVEQYRAQQLAKGAQPIWAATHVKRHRIQQSAQGALRASMAWWGGLWQDGDSNIQKRFYYQFGIDVLSAQSLKATEAIELADRINLHLGRMI